MITPIGTPLAANATKVMLLGSGELGKEVAIALMRLGVEVIAVDRYQNAPAQQVAHRAYTIDMTDGAAIRALVVQERPDLVVPEIEAIATDELLAIEAEKLATVIPTARATRLTMNREGIRRLAAEELGLPTSPYRFADSLAEVTQALEQIGYPAVIKPVMSSSGHGQSVLRGPDDVAGAWEYACSGGRVATTRVIVEGFVPFDYEITQLTVRALGPGGQVATYFCEPVGHRQVDGDYVESWQPQPMTAAAKAEAHRLAAAVTGALGGRGIFGVELFVKGDQVLFSEVSPRPHDTGMVTMATQRLSEFDLHARAILGLPVDVALSRPGASAVVYGRFEGGPVAYDGVAQALALPGIDLRLFGKPAAALPHRRLGVALATADTVDEARRRAGEAAGLVEARPA
ncbi:MAG: formate-dependent phosphoribosylglycinamide formyltransferase [Bifidobacteriaceae bacterium]|nr:formate-dependent phosphoribosylglycinamide formyltransferase [Bifidobacteriaceae bacterium]